MDAFHPVNVGRIMIGDYRFVPCTPAGVIELLERSGVELEGKECVVIGRSNIVGKPMAMLLLHKNATVTICHSRTKDLADVVRRADVVGGGHRPPEVPDGGHAEKRHRGDRCGHLQASGR